MIDIIETVFAVAFFIGVIVTAIVGTVNPKEDSFLWKIVHILNYISMANPRDVKVITWCKYNQLMDKDKNKDDKGSDN